LGWPVDQPDVSRGPQGRASGSHAGLEEDAMHQILSPMTMLRSTLLLIVAVPFTTAFAGTLALAALSVDATAVPFDDEPENVTIDLELDEERELVVVLGADGVGIGRVIVPQPELAADLSDDEAFDRAPTINVLARSETIEDAQTGVVYLHDTADLAGVTTAYVDRLDELGFQVSLDGPIVHATNGDSTYRIVLGLDAFEDEHAVRVYLGR
jgi:hypothetical protein